MDNAMIQPVNVGGNAAGDAAMAQKYFPLYQRMKIEAQSNGGDLPPYDVWLRTYLAHGQQPSRNALLNAQ